MKKQQSPLYDADLIRAEMARKRVTADQIVKTSRKIGATPISLVTIGRVRAGRNVRISNLKIICDALGLEVKIVERPSA